MGQFSKVFINALFALIVLTAVGCSASAHIEKDDTVNFSRYRSFEWADKTIKERNSNDILDSKLKAEVEKHLTEKGWAYDKLNPDVLLDYNLLVETNVRQEKEAVYSQPVTRYFYNPYTRRVTPVFYPSQFIGYEDYELPVKEGTITLHMIDNSSNKLVWQGWTSEVMNNKNISSQEISEGVNTILKKFKIEG